MQYGLRTSIYLQTELRVKILEFIRERKGKYSSLSHFFMVAAIKLLREEEDG